MAGSSVGASGGGCGGPARRPGRAAETSVSTGMSSPGGAAFGWLPGLAAARSQPLPGRSAKKPRMATSAARGDGGRSGGGEARQVRRGRRQGSMLTGSVSTLNSQPAPRTPAPAATPPAIAPMGALELDGDAGGGWLRAAGRGGERFRRGSNPRNARQPCLQPAIPGGCCWGRQHGGSDCRLRQRRWQGDRRWQCGRRQDGRR